MGIPEKQRHHLAPEVRQRPGSAMVVREGQRVAEFRSADVSPDKPWRFGRRPIASDQAQAQQ
jgi:hypothetical protein